MCSPDTAGAESRQPRKRGSAELYIEHGHYYIMHADKYFPGAYSSEWTDDKLLYPAFDDDEDGGIFVRTGTFWGPLVITVETYDSAEQARPDDGEWEIRQEVGIVAKGPNLRVETNYGAEIDLPPLHLAPGEAAGARLHARGVAEAAEIQELTGPDDRPVEFHLLQLWRA